MRKLEHRGRVDAPVHSFEMPIARSSTAERDPGAPGCGRLRWKEKALTKRRPRMQITLVGIVILLVAAAIVGAAFVHRVNLLMLLFSLIVAMVVVGSWSGRRQLHGLVLTRNIPSMVEAGVPFAWSVQVTGRRPGRALLGLLASDPVSPPVPLCPKSVRLWPATPGSAALGRHVMAIAQRGEYRFGPTRLSTAYPFGFVKWSDQFQKTGEGVLLVYPAIGRLTSLARHRLGLASIGGGSSRLGLIEGFDEFRSVRDYRDGDPPRLIHWRTTARRGSLVVREAEPAASRNLLLIVEPRLCGHAPDSARLAETVLSFAATVVFDVCRGASIELTLLLIGPEPSLVRGLASPHRRDAFLRPLSTVELTQTAPDMASIRRRLRTEDVRDRRLWMVTTMDPRVSVAGLLSAAASRRLSQRTLLNASAGDLEGYWKAPNAPGEGA